MIGKVRVSILPCPFCGSLPEIAKHPCEELFTINCTNYECILSFDCEYLYLKNVITRWNTRINVFEPYEIMVNIEEIEDTGIEGSRNAKNTM